MTKVTLGSTGITTDRNAFGALPIQRVNREEAIKILKKAYDGGITFFDTARMYSDSEEKIGQAFKGMREKIFIASKTMSNTPEGFWQDLETSLSSLQTDYVDIYQFHNPGSCYRPGDGSGMYECMLEAKKQGKIKHIGLTNHKLGIANECINSGLYETLQYPFSYLSMDKEIELVKKCKLANMGFIAMKALSGGLITDSAAAYAFMTQFSNVLPIWGIQQERELDEFLSYMDNPPQMTDEKRAWIEKEQRELTGEFCRGCGYCMPCPAGITINTCARMSLMIRRSPAENWLTPKGQEMMRNIEDCTACGECKTKCPYSLDTPELLKKNYEDYKKILAGAVKV
ncbi:MAG TPA: aldo/keto reductase [Patescibacteria group bacterium]|nr:aldo/keto reductase [Patescibacteria group bacterium]